MKVTHSKRCEYRGCAEPATVGCRFGNGTMPGKLPQPFVSYCNHHLVEVEKLFVLCDVRALGPGGRITRCCPSSDERSTDGQRSVAHVPEVDGSAAAAA